MADNESRKPAQVYRGLVAETLDARSRASSYVPKVALDLSIVGRRCPRTPADLDDDERQQLRAIFEPDETLEQALANEEYEIEVARVIDEQGAVRFRLYGWNYGAGWLFPAGGLDVVAFAAQHDLEHWHLDQRDVFVAMDRALAKRDHGFRQPLDFCWAKDECWQKLEGVERGTLGSEPYLRKRFAEAAKR